MERDDRPPVATFFLDEPLYVGEVATLVDPAAHHARVKRLEAGNVVRLVDGRGNVGIGTISAMRKGAVDVLVERTEEIASPSPIHLRVPIGDRDRMLWLAEKATELGISTWQAIRFRRSASVSPRGEGSTFREKVQARMVSALEQSGGAWLPTIFPDAELSDIVLRPESLALLLDVTGQPLAPVVAARPAYNPVLLFGPEGGLEPDERSYLIAQGWTPVRLASTTLRFETAGMAAVAVVRGVHDAEEPD